MAASFKKSDRVRLIQPVIEGTVVRPDIVDDELCYLVEFSDSDGETQQRHFREDQLEPAV